MVSITLIVPSSDLPQDTRCVFMLDVRLAAAVAEPVGGGAEGFERGMKRSPALRGLSSSGGVVPFRKIFFFIVASQSQNAP